MTLRILSRLLAVLGSAWLLLWTASHRVVPALRRHPPASLSPGRLTRTRVLINGFRVQSAVDEAGATLGGSARARSPNAAPSMPERTGSWEPCKAEYWENAGGSGSGDYFTRRAVLATLLERSMHHRCRLRCRTPAAFLGGVLRVAH
jgi:hypothetical protein